MTDGTEEVPRLKPEAEFTNRLIDIGNKMYWMLLSEDIKGDLERARARHEREDLYGRAEKEAV